MLERPPTVVPANVVPVGTIACPRNCRRGGFVPCRCRARADDDRDCGDRGNCDRGDPTSEFRSCDPPRETKVVILRSP